MPPQYKDDAFTEPPPAMQAFPECIVEGDSITSYRNYYWEAKRDFAKWTKRENRSGGMNGKGSKQRPLSVSQNKFDAQWDLIFGGKNMKYHRKEVTISETISRHMSANGKNEAVVIKTERGYVVELYEQSRYIQNGGLFFTFSYWAEDVAENFCTGNHIP